MTTLVSIHRKTRRFLKARDGSSVVEFAIALPVLCMVLFGIIEMAAMMFAVILAEGGLREASRYGVTGQVPAGLTREEQIVTIVQNHTHGLFDVSTANVSMKVYPSFNDIGEAEPLTLDVNGNGEYDEADGDTFEDINGNGVWDKDMGVPGSGGPDDIVFYELEFQWDFLTPVFAVFGGPDGTVDMKATIAVRNEPYNEGT
ncbi:MAG: TadE/TadG family type IV pilus assembly protein [Kiloniellales bacterium]